MPDKKQYTILLISFGLEAFAQTWVYNRLSFGNEYGLVKADAHGKHAQKHKLTAAERDHLIIFTSHCIEEYFSFNFEEYISSYIIFVAL